MYGVVVVVVVVCSCVLYFCCYLHFSGALACSCYCCTLLMLLLVVVVVVVYTSVVLSLVVDEFLEEHRQLLEGRLQPITREVTDVRARSKDELEGEWLSVSCECHMHV